MGQRRGSPAPAFLPDNDDILLEILLRLPPLPSSLPRASLVCKRGRRLLSDPDFLRRFRAHHRKPPILGFFAVDFFNHDGPIPVFTPTLAAPDRIPPARFSFPNQPDECLLFLGLTALPPEMKRNYRHRHLKFDMYNGAVMGNCCSGAFKVVMVFTNALYGLAWACLYDSESGKWGNIISTAVPSSTSLAQPSILVGNAVCWLLHIEWGGVLRFDTDKQSLDVVKIPEDIHVTNDSRVDLLRTVDGGLGIAILSKQIIQLWGQTAVSDHVVTWVLQKTIELDKFISLSPSVETQPTTIVGFDEDNNVIFLWTTIGIFMIQLESMKFTALSKDNCI
ncbi:unnamed protein product [Urochloa decumbens]|uniref:F-box domain-containing protein n=1 Tax=Urochloa decumbens TaxID=240449 RepID=A0ABC8VL64_9POAL